jgi:hypothetical protein
MVRAARAALERFRRTRRLAAWWPELAPLNPVEVATVKASLRDIIVWECTRPGPFRQMVLALVAMAVVGACAPSGTPARQAGDDFAGRAVRPAHEPGELVVPPRSARAAALLRMALSPEDAMRPAGESPANSYPRRTPGPVAGAVEGSARGSTAGSHLAESGTPRVRGVALLPRGVAVAVEAGRGATTSPAAAKLLDQLDALQARADRLLARRVLPFDAAAAAQDACLDGVGSVSFRGDEVVVRCRQTPRLPVQRPVPSSMIERGARETGSRPAPQLSTSEDVDGPGAQRVEDLARAGLALAGGAP